MADPRSDMGSIPRTDTVPIPRTNTASASVDARTNTATVGADARTNTASVGVDVGSGSVRAAVFDHRGNRRAAHSRAKPGAAKRRCAGFHADGHTGCPGGGGPGRSARERR